MQFSRDLSQQSRFFWWIVGFALISLLGVIDYKAGIEFRFAFFYLIPVTLVAWFTGMKPGVAASTLSILSWLTANLLLGNGFSNLKVGFGNTATILGFYLVVSLLASKLSEALRRERGLARSDYLTGALNARAFYEIAQMEIDRARRYKHPFTIAYFDVDNFKAVNDQAGHHAGDDLLRIIVKTIKESIRATDRVARLGGDEFAVLFPESRSESIDRTINRIQEKLLAVASGGLAPVTFSIGALTCLSSPPTVNEIMKIVDRLMYSVKSEGKNRLKHEILTEPQDKNDLASAQSDINN